MPRPPGQTPAQTKETDFRLNALHQGERVIDAVCTVLRCLPDGHPLQDMLTPRVQTHTPPEESTDHPPVEREKGGIERHQIAALMRIADALEMIQKSVGFQRPPAPAHPIDCPGRTTLDFKAESQAPSRDAQHIAYAVERATAPMAEHHGPLMNALIDAIRDMNLTHGHHMAALNETMNNLNQHAHEQVNILQGIASRLDDILQTMPDK